eukprot:EG_transcript_44756
MRCVMNVVIVPLPSLTLHLCSHAPATLSPHKYPFPFSACTLPFSVHTPEQHTDSPTTQTATQKDAPPLFLNVSGGAILYPSSAVQCLIATALLWFNPRHPASSSLPLEAHADLVLSCSQPTTAYLLL